MIALTPTVQVWIGSDYTIDFITVVIIAANVYIGGMLYTPFNYRQTMGLFIYGKWRPIFSTVINIFASIWMGSIWGLKGVLAGTIIARLTTNGWYDPFIVYRKGFNQSPATYYVKYIFYFVLLIISGIIGIGIEKIYVTGGLFDILLHCSLCFIVLSTFYYLLFRKTDSFQYLCSVGKECYKKIRKKVNEV